MPADFLANLKQSFSRIKEEFNNHLDSINANTNEISSNYENILELEMKIDKLSEKLDDIYMMLSEEDVSVRQKTPAKIDLNLREQELFMLLYEKNGDLLDYRKISRTLGLTENLIEKTVSAMAMKGVPIIKRYVDEKVYLLLDTEFRNLQAKQNIIPIKDVIKRRIVL